ncbi:HNH endonuclease [Methylobacterium phyllosphaerae]
MVCGRRIDGVRERWIVEHIRALELGGADDLENMGPAHEACGREKTRDDHARTAWAKRQKIRHLGAAVIARPLPGSRACALKRKINGAVVARDSSDSGRVDRESNSEPREAPAGEPSTRSVEIRIDPVNPLCTHPARSAKKNQARTEAPMTNQAPPLRTRERVRPRQDTSSSGDVRPAIPAHLDFLFDDRPLLPGECAEQYDALRDSIVQQVKPTDVIEAIWVKDTIDLIWEAKRLRRWRGQILVQARLKAAADLIRPAFDYANPVQIEGVTGPSVDALAAGWTSGKKSSQDQVDKYLQERDLTTEDVTAHAFLLNLPAIERIDRLASLADQRRDSLLREIERKRASFAQQLHIAAADVLDVEHTKTW